MKAPHKGSHSLSRIVPPPLPSAKKKIVVYGRHETHRRPHLLLLPPPPPVPLPSTSVALAAERTQVRRSTPPTTVVPPLEESQRTASTLKLSSPVRPPPGVSRCTLSPIPTRIVPWMVQQAMPGADPKTAHRGPPIRTRVPWGLSNRSRDAPPRSCRWLLTGE